VVVRGGRSDEDGRSVDWDSWDDAWRRFGRGVSNAEVGLRLRSVGFVGCRRRLTVLFWSSEGRSLRHFPSRSCFDARTPSSNHLSIVVVVVELVDFLLSVRSRTQRLVVGLSLPRNLRVSPTRPRRPSARLPLPKLVAWTSVEEGVGKSVRSRIGEGRWSSSFLNGVRRRS